MAPTSPAFRRRHWIGGLGLLLCLAGALFWAFNASGLPGPGTVVYERYAEAFQLGVAALDADVAGIADEQLTLAVNLIPDEPAGWANRGLLYLRTEQLPEAAADLEHARSLAPFDPAIQKLLGMLARRQGRFSDAATHFRAAADRDPKDIRSLYLLNEVLEQENQKGVDAIRLELCNRMLEIQPSNLKLLTDRLRLALKIADVRAISDTINRLKLQSVGWAEATRQQLMELEMSLSVSEGSESLLSVLRFSNMLLPEPAFRRSLAEVAPSDVLPGEPLPLFLRLIPIASSPATADTGLTFTSESLPNVPDGRWDVVKSVWLVGDKSPSVFAANSLELRCLDETHSLPSMSVSLDGLISFDVNNDARMDLLLAGSEGLRFFEQQDDGQLVDLTSKLDLPEEFLHTAFASAFAADVDFDGDLDVLLSAASGSPWFLRNNFDGTMTPRNIFESANGPQNFAWADLDQDGAPDAALLDAEGRLRVFANERMAEFREWPVPPPVDRLGAMVVMDANDDGVFDIVTLKNDGTLLAISDQDKRASWKTLELGRWDVKTLARSRSFPLLRSADFDNNGTLDLLASGDEHSQIWLGSGGGRFLPLATELPPRILSTLLSSEGRIDLLGLDADGRPARLKNRGSRNYHWQTVRLRAAGGEGLGDNRINSFSIGGEIELKTGTHIVKMPIEAPVIHFGLGDRSRSDVLRIVWPNGTSQFEFRTPIDQTVQAVQRLKGSCPFLFAWNGEQFEFVTDFMWSTPLGMYINAADKGGFAQTTDWVKIPRNQLAQKEGQYELRVNANLWETHFFDHLALMVVDHPDGTELFVDERFHMRPADPAFHLTEAPQPVARAWDHRGNDATAELQRTDGVHLDRSGRGRYQGVTHDHWVEADLGDDAPSTGPVWLIARGWIHPTDSSVNYALEQGQHERPNGLVLELPDGRGGWKPGLDRLGFPAGKNKTMLIRLDGIDGPGVARRFRLRTNMEIYWDSLQYARGCDNSTAVPQLLKSQVANLRYRGIVSMSQDSPSSPEIPHYDSVASRQQIWRDLIGYYTRFGEIRELLEEIDDHYAILNAGDEIILKFDAPAGPSDGFQRDFVFVADGWVKDGDFNTRFGKTVLPLPSHDLQSYREPPTLLSNDPVFRRHSTDWERWHTRLITPESFERGLRRPRPQNSR